MQTKSIHKTKQRDISGCKQTEQNAQGGSERDGDESTELKTFQLEKRDVVILRPHDCSVM